MEKAVLAALSASLALCMLGCAQDAPASSSSSSTSSSSDFSSSDASIGSPAISYSEAISIYSDFTGSSSEDMDIIGECVKSGDYGRAKAALERIEKVCTAVKDMPEPPPPLDQGHQYMKKAAVYSMTAASEYTKAVRLVCENSAPDLRDELIKNGNDFLSQSSQALGDWSAAVED